MYTNHFPALGHFTRAGGWKSTYPLFRDLSPEEVQSFQRYAEEHDPPTTTSPSILNPICRNVWIARGLMEVA